MGDVYASALLDSGSVRSLVAETLASQCCAAGSFESRRIALRTAANQSLEAIGLCSIDFLIRERIFRHQFIVARLLVADAILGTEIMIAQIASLHFRVLREAWSSYFTVHWPVRATECVSSVTSCATSTEIDEETAVPLLNTG